MTFILVGVDHLEGGGTGGPHRDGSQQLDVVLRVVQRHDGSLFLVLTEQRVNVISASYGNLTHCRPGNQRRTSSDMMEVRLDTMADMVVTVGLDTMADTGKTVNYGVLDH